MGGRRMQWPRIPPPSASRAKECPIETKCDPQDGHDPARLCFPFCTTATLLMPLRV